MSPWDGSCGIGGNFRPAAFEPGKQHRLRQAQASLTAPGIGAI